MKRLSGLLKKLFLSGDQDSVARISNSIQGIQAQSEEEFDAHEHDFNRALVEKKLSLIEEVLNQASNKTGKLSQLLENLNETEVVENQESNPLNSAIEEIASACNEVSLNGIKILAGDEVHLNLDSKQFSIKLPDHAKNAFGLNSEEADKNLALSQVDDLEKAIESSRQELKKIMLEMDISRQNLRSAGIKAVWLEEQEFKE